MYTGGGVSVDGNVNTGGGDFIGRDKKVSAGERSVAIDGSVSGSTIVTGENNTLTNAENITNSATGDIGLEVNDKIISILFLAASE